MIEPVASDGGGRRLLGRVATLRVRLTVAVAILAGAGLTAGGALLVHAVESTVVRTIEDQGRAELRLIGGQIAGGVPLDAVRAAPGHQLTFVRPDGTRVERFPDGGPRPLPPPPEGPVSRAVPLPGARAVFRSPDGGRAPCPVSSPDGMPGAIPIPNGGPAGPAVRDSRPVPPSGVSAPEPSPGMSTSPPAASSWMGGPLPAPLPGRLLPPAVRDSRRVPPGVHGPLPPPGVPGDLDDGPRFWSVIEMPVESPELGPIRAVTRRPLEDVLRSTHTLQQILTLGIPALVALLTLAAWWLIGRALRPVRVMTQTAAGIADATAPERLAVPPARDELGELAHTLNGMLDRLAEGARRQREFVSDASHELRSPIAATRAQIEVALAHPDRTSAAAVLRGVLAETTRLEALVADLLALARLDERRAHVAEEIDLDDVVLEDAARMRAVAVDTQGVTAVKVHGERKSLAHLVRNLLDNAGRHAVSQVVVATYLDDGVPVLVVEDDGAGIAEADRARVFERFTRLSSSRSRDDGGAGLGLALVQRVATQHGGQARVDRSPLGGARFEVRFARAAPIPDARNVTCSAQ